MATAPLTPPTQPREKWLDFLIVRRKETAYGLVVLAERRVLHYLPRAQYQAT